MLREAQCPDVAQTDLAASRGHWGLLRGHLLCVAWMRTMGSGCGVGAGAEHTGRGDGRCTGRVGEPMWSSAARPPQDRPGVLPLCASCRCARVLRLGVFVAAGLFSLERAYPESLVSDR